MIAAPATPRVAPGSEPAGLLRRRRGLILAIAVLGTALVGGAAFLIPPRFTAKAQIVVEPQLSSLIAGQPAMIDQQPDEATLLTQLTAIKSHDHLRKVLDSLASDPALHGSVSRDRGPSRELAQQIWARVADWVPRSVLAALSGPAWLTLPLLERHLTVFQEAGSHVIAVAYTSDNPQEAATIANRVTQLFVAHQIAQQRASIDSALAWFDRRIPELAKRVQQLDVRLQQYQTAQGLGDTSRANLVDARITDLSRQLTTAETDLAGRKSRYDAIRAMQARGGIDAVIPYFDTPALGDLRRNETALLQNYAAMSVSFPNTNPRMVQMRGQLQSVRRDMARSVEAAIAGLAGEAQAAAAQVATLRGQLGALQHASTDANLRSLEREATSTRHLYESLEQRREELREQREGLPPTVRLLSLAATPERPSSPSPFLFLPPAAVLFSLCGAFAAVLLDRMDVTLRSERDVAELLGIPCIGLVPLLRRRGRLRPHHYLVEKPFAPYSEAIRSVVAGLGVATPRRSTGVILVTSSLPGEGKTTLAVSLAVYAAQLRQRVLLIDLDFRHPAVLRELGGVTESGMGNIFQKDRSVSDHIMHHPDLNLDFLPVRQGLGVDPVRLFATEQLPQLLQQLRTRYDCIIIDSAPLLAVTETRLLAPLADTVLLAVQWAKTRREVARNALALMRTTSLVEDDGAGRVVSALTQVDIRKHARYRYGDSGEFLVEYAQYLTPSGGKWLPPAGGRDNR